MGCCATYIVVVILSNHRKIGLVFQIGLDIVVASIVKAIDTCQLCVVLGK